MENDNIIVLKSAYGKTQGQTYHITPCVDPETGMLPPHIRERDSFGQLILSEEDKAEVVKQKDILSLEEIESKAAPFATKR